MKKTTKLQEALNVQSGHANTLHNYAKMLHYGRGDAMLAESLYRRILDKVSLSVSLCVYVSLSVSLYVSLSVPLSPHPWKTLFRSLSVCLFFSCLSLFFSFSMVHPPNHFGALLD